MKVYNYDKTKNSIIEYVRKDLEEKGIIIIQITSIVDKGRQTVCKVQDYNFNTISGFGYEINVRMLEEVYHYLFMEELLKAHNTIDFDFLSIEAELNSIDEVEAAFEDQGFTFRIIETYCSYFFLIEKCK